MLNLNKDLPITFAKGHKGNAGATGCGYKEEELTDELVELLLVRFRKLGYNAIDVSPTGSYTAKEQLVAEYTNANKITNAQLHICVHFNASNGQGHGTETWIYALGNKTNEYATVINDAICNVLGTTNRGVKASGNSLAIPRRVNAPVCLIETVFIDNQSDMNKYIPNKEKVADAIVEALTGEVLTTQPSVEPTITVEPTTPTSETTKVENVVVATKPIQQTESVFDKAKKYNSTKCTELQTKLNKCGYDCGTVDGIYGEKTHNALGKMQSENGLTVDYLAGDMTFKKLDELITKKSTVSSSNDWVLRLQKELNKQEYRDKNGKKLVEDGLVGELTLSACPTLKKGAYGDITGLLQEKLNSLGYLCGTVDKDFGGKTYNAVVKFQKAKGLKQDGLFGEKSWRKLLGL